jgi:tetratricopeptide (TPR) repeat protein
MTGKQIEALLDALCSAFNQDTLDEMLRLRLDKSRQELAGSGNFRTVVFNVIEAADRGGWSAELIRAAKSYNPGNPSLRSFGEDFAPSEKLDPHSIPKAPDFYAEPDYIGSHKFIGRDSQLQELSDWARPADPTNLLLFEAIGGNGKSMLTWEWVTNPKHAVAARTADSAWAGRFWYSFYERGAIMADFCQRALAYMTGRPREDFAKKKTAALASDLLAQLHARPWLLILDGLERVLVAYHRIDAAEVPDEEANAPVDKIVNRNPCDAIREEDNDLLRALAGSAPSKILVTSRLTPRVLLNSAGQAIPGARRVDLPGLRPADAEALLRSCGRKKDSDPGIRGESAAIRAYLTENCDNHPLAIGVLGGLINKPGPNRGDFDAWAADPDGGAGLDLASLDLIQRRNHILRVALDTHPPASRQLLSILALLSVSVNYETLKALNPHLPPEPEEVEKPEPPEDDWPWHDLSDEQKADRRKQYEGDLQRRKDYEQAVQARLASEECRAAPKKLAETVGDLERRGLLQWDGRTQKYDLHPVIRGVAAGGMMAEDRERHGRRVVDYFSSLPHDPYEQAETLEDLRPGVYVVRTLLKLGHFQEAASAFRGAISNALIGNVEAYPEILSLLRPFFPTGWRHLPQNVETSDAAYLANGAGIALAKCGELDEALTAGVASLQSDLEEEAWVAIGTELLNISSTLFVQNRPARATRLTALALDFATVLNNIKDVFVGRLRLFEAQTEFGLWAEAIATWRLLDPMGRDWSRSAYRSGWAERSHARFQFYNGTLDDARLVAAERLAVQGKSRAAIRSLHRLRGAWRLERGESALAAASLAEAVRMARERGIPDVRSEIGLALAKQHLGQLVEAQREAERLARLAELREPAHRYLAMLWQAIGDFDQAKRHALAAYKWAWADGEPYVHRHELTKTTELLQQLKIPIPNLPPYDPANDPPFPWEAHVRAAIEKLRTGKQMKIEEQ